MEDYAHSHLVEVAFETGRADRIADLQSNQQQNKLKLAAERFPADEESFKSYLLGWSSVWVYLTAPIP